MPYFNENSCHPQLMVMDYFKDYMLKYNYIIEGRDVNEKYCYFASEQSFYWRKLRVIHPIKIIF